MLEFAIPIVTVAVILSVAVLAITDYLVAPLKNTPKVAAFLVRIGLAYPKEPDKSSVGDNITIWIIPYVTFGFSFLLSYMFQLDFMSKLLGTTVNPLAARLLTAAAVGGGSSVIHRISAK